MRKLCIVCIIVLAWVGISCAYDFVVTVPDNKAVQLRDALCIAWNYETNKRCIDPNCVSYETKKQFIERKLRRWIQDQINNYLEKSAAVAAKNAVTLIELE